MSHKRTGLLLIDGHWHSSSKLHILLKERDPIEKEKVGKKVKKSGLSDSNQRPRDTSSFPLGVLLLQSHALPTELRPVDAQDQIYFE